MAWAAAGEVGEGVPASAEEGARLSASQIPEGLTHAMSLLWEAESARIDELLSVKAQLQELVQTR